jgi:hypothetical protein
MPKLLQAIQATHEAGEQVRNATKHIQALADAGDQELEDLCVEAGNVTEAIADLHEKLSAVRERRLKR